MTIEVTEREAWLLAIIRQLGNGVIERVGIVNGEPEVAMIGAPQRLDFKHDGSKFPVGVLDMSAHAAVQSLKKKAQKVTERPSGESLETDLAPVQIADS